MKKRLEGARGKWTKELPNVLWAYRTMSRRSTDETPYSLTYEVEAVIPVEISLYSSRTLNFSLATNNKLMVRQFIGRALRSGDYTFSKLPIEASLTI